MRVEKKIDKLRAEARDLIPEPENNIFRTLARMNFRTTKIKFRVSDTIGNILKELPYFASAEFSTDFMESRSALRADLKRQGLLFTKWSAQFQIIYGLKSKAKSASLE